MDEAKSIDEGWDGPVESGGEPGSAAARNNDWVVNTSGHDLAEMSKEQIAAALRAGELSERALVWRTGMKDWMTLADVPSLQIVLRRVSREAMVPPAATSWEPSAPTMAAASSPTLSVASVASGESSSTIVTSTSAAPAVSLEPSSQTASRSGNTRTLALASGAATPKAPQVTPLTASDSGEQRASAPVRSISPSPSRPRASRPGSSPSGRAAPASVAGRPASSSGASAAVATARQPSSAGAASVLKSVCVSVTNTPESRRAELQTTVRVSRSELPAEFGEPIDHSAATMRVPRAAVAAARASAEGSNLVDENVTLVKMPDGWRDSVAQLTQTTVEFQPSATRGAMPPRNQSKRAPSFDPVDSPPSSRTVLVRDGVESDSPGTLAPIASDAEAEPAPLVHRLVPLDSRRMLAARPVQRNRSPWFATVLACVASALVASVLTAVLLDESRSRPTPVLSSPGAIARPASESGASSMQPRFVAPASSPTASAPSSAAAAPPSASARAPVAPLRELAPPARQAPASMVRVREPERAATRRKPRPAPRSEQPASDNPYVEPTPAAPARTATAAFAPAPAGALGREAPVADPASDAKAAPSH